MTKRKRLTVIESVKSMPTLDETREFVDAGQRIVDTVSLHLVAYSDVMTNVYRWCAFKLADGTSDGEVYDTKDDAIRHQKGDPKLYCYLEITPDGITLRDALSFLKTNRLWFIDSTAPAHVINPHLYPQHSNMTPTQKALLRFKEIEAMKNGN